MPKHIYIVPNPQQCKLVVDSLYELGLTDEHIGVVAKDNVSLEALPEADYEDENDLVGGAKRGAAVGGAAGLLAGMSAVALAPAGIVIGGAGLALATMGGASFGTFVAAMIGVSVPNSQLREYEEKMEKGSVLLIVELEEGSIDSIQSELKARHPDIIAEGGVGVVPPAL